ncbi:MAG: hypothetical protein K0U52_12780 [Gammaproteobacteria bacterium]|nr:hypothetical protein [Gammaproteobacteria bacterium]
MDKQVECLEDGDQANNPNAANDKGNKSLMKKHLTFMDVSTPETSGDIGQLGANVFRCGTMPKSKSANGGSFKVELVEGCQ